MNNIILKLFAATLSFGIGIALAFAWMNFNSVDSNTVDKRLMTAISRVQLKEIEKTCKRKTLSSEECNYIKEFVNSETFSAQLARDIANTNAGCEHDGFSEAQCVARKEKAIRDIEEILLTDNLPEPIDMKMSRKHVIIKYETQQKMVFVEHTPSVKRILPAN